MAISNLRDEERGYWEEIERQKYASQMQSQAMSEYAGQQQAVKNRAPIDKNQVTRERQLLLLDDV